MIKRITFSLLILSHCLFALGQTNPSSTILAQNDSYRIISVAVPFLGISPDSRGASLGDIGVSTTPDLESTYWNPAKLSLMQTDFGISLSYSPWLAKIVNDMSLSYLTMSKRVSKTQVIGLNLRYFNLGDIDLKNNQGDDIGSINPREFALSGTYSHALGKHFAIGSNLRFIYSNLLGSSNAPSNDAKPGTAFSVDIGLYHFIPFEVKTKKYVYSWGLNISNVGNKISYNDAQSQDFIPTNLRLGNSIRFHLDYYNTLTFSYEVNKLLVPTPPEYKRDSDGKIELDSSGNPVILRGENPDKSLLEGVFGSLFDAPGGFSEEWEEITHHFGLEYTYKNNFSARLGYFLEHPNKGNRKYLSIGAGAEFNQFGLNIAYLVPSQTSHPLAETVRFSIHWKFYSEIEKEKVTMPVGN